MCCFIVMRWPLSVKAEQVHNRAILIRHTARAALTLERLQEEAHGDLVYPFTKPWSDGTIGITRSPLELLEK